MSLILERSKTTPCYEPNLNPDLLGQQEQPNSSFPCSRATSRLQPAHPPAVTHGSHNCLATTINALRLVLLASIHASSPVSPTPDAVRSGPNGGGQAPSAAATTTAGTPPPADAADVSGCCPQLGDGLGLLSDILGLLLKIVPRPTTVEVAAAAAGVEDVVGLEDGSEGREALVQLLVGYAEEELLQGSWGAGGEERERLGRLVERAFSGLNELAAQVHELATACSGTGTHTAEGPGDRSRRRDGPLGSSGASSMDSTSVLRVVQQLLSHVTQLEPTLFGLCARPPVAAAVLPLLLLVGSLKLAALRLLCLQRNILVQGPEAEVALETEAEVASETEAETEPDHRAELAEAIATYTSLAQEAHDTMLNWRKGLLSFGRRVPTSLAQHHVAEGGSTAMTGFRYMGHDALHQLQHSTILQTAASPAGVDNDGDDGGWSYRSSDMHRAREVFDLYSKNVMEELARRLGRCLAPCRLWGYLDPDNEEKPVRRPVEYWSPVFGVDCYRLARQFSPFEDDFPLPGVPRIPFVWLSTSPGSSCVEGIRCRSCAYGASPFDSRQVHQVVLTLDDGEVFTAVWGRAGDLVEEVTFVTSSGREVGLRAGGPFRCGVGGVGSHGCSCGCCKGREEVGLGGDVAGECGCCCSGSQGSGVQGLEGGHGACATEKYDREGCFRSMSREVGIGGGDADSILPPGGGNGDIGDGNDGSYGIEDGSCRRCGSSSSSAATTVKWSATARGGSWSTQQSSSSGLVSGRQGSGSSVGSVCSGGRGGGQWWRSGGEGHELVAIGGYEEPGRRLAGIKFKWREWVEE